MRKSLTGSSAAAEAMKQINPEVVAIYPITPQSPIAQRFSDFVSEGLVDTELIRVESEHSAMSACVGSSAAGARTLTATSSQGLALMFEILYVASGLRLPIVMNVVNRALSAPINIHCDHSDTMGTRDSGWIQLYCENAQEVYDMSLIAQRLAEKVFLPVMVCQDGFIISHSTEPVEILEDKKVKNFVKEFKPRVSLLEKPITIGPYDTFDYYFEHKIEQIKFMNQVIREFKQISNEYKKISKRKSDLFETYKLNDAEIAIVILSSTAGTVKYVVDELRKKGIKAGLLKPVMFKPFPYEEIYNKLKKIKYIAVMERYDAFGSYPALFTELRSAFYNYKERPAMLSYVFGLGGRQIKIKEIEKVFDDLIRTKRTEKIKKSITYIGVKDG